LIALIAASVSACCQQRPFNVRKSRAAPKIRRRHSRHPLIDKKQRGRLISQFELLDKFERSRPRVGSHHAKSLSVLPPQVPLNRAKNVHVIVNGENHWFLHVCSWPSNLAVGMPFLLFGLFITWVRVPESLQKNPSRIRQKQSASFHSPSHETHETHCRMLRNSPRRRTPCGENSESAGVTSGLDQSRIIDMKIGWILSLVVVVVGWRVAHERKVRSKQSRRRSVAADEPRHAMSARREPGGVGVGWGDIRFEQAGSTVSGAMGNYSARGVVRGSRVFLALSSGGYVHYTVVLTKSAEMLSGFYSPSVPFSQADQAAVTLRRIGD
jgi:hypothetical protein